MGQTSLLTYFFSHLLSIELVKQSIKNPDQLIDYVILSPYFRGKKLGKVMLDVVLIGKIVPILHFFMLGFQYFLLVPLAPLEIVQYILLFYLPNLN